MLKAALINTSTIILITFFKMGVDFCLSACVSLHLCVCVCLSVCVGVFSLSYELSGRL